MMRDVRERDRPLYREILRWKEQKKSSRDCTCTLEDSMSNQDFVKKVESVSRNQGVTTSAGAAREVFANASAIAGDVAEKAHHAVAETAGTMIQQVRQILDRQVDTGAEVVGGIAGAVKRTADELDREAPQLAGLVRAAGEQIDCYAGNLRDQSVDQLVRTASNFTRRQPAMVFGLAALAGFVALRTVKSTSSPTSSPSTRSTVNGRDSHGA
jgi:hypothetical protein